MSEVDRIVQELERDHSGEPWHGSSVSEILAKVTAAEASARPLPPGHTVWELVLHMTSWKNEVGRRLTGAQASVPQDGDWPEVGSPTPERWTEALSRLHAAHAALLAKVQDLPKPAFCSQRTIRGIGRPGMAASYYVLLHGLVQHDAYHAGQLAMLIKSVRAR